jgi:hypothetical protein
MTANFEAPRQRTSAGFKAGASALLIEHDLFRKPVPTPDHVGGMLFGIMLSRRARCTGAAGVQAVTATGRRKP